MNVVRFATLESTQHGAEASREIIYIMKDVFDNRWEGIAEVDNHIERSWHLHVGDSILKINLFLKFPKTSCCYSFGRY